MLQETASRESSHGSRIGRTIRVLRGLVYLLCSERRLPHVRLGTGRGTIRVMEDDINEFVKSDRIDAFSLSKGLKHIRAK
jgi:hypothetical protein